MNGGWIVVLPKHLVPHWWLVAYKMPPPLGERYREVFEIDPGERFNEVVKEHLIGLLEKGVEPPAEIAPAIYNLANDFVSNRDMLIRTGDYITLMTYVKNKM